MEKIKRPSPVNHHEYSIDVENPLTKYGLPPKVEFCSRCVISNQRPNSAVEYANLPGDKKKTIQFDISGVCDACKFTEIKKNEIDWIEREKELVELCNRHRRSDGSYDCIVPGSGGKDSFYASHVLRNKYGMHPLTVTWAPHIYTEWGWRNFQSWIHAGHDNYLMTPNGKVHRLLTRLSTELLLHPFQPFMFGQKSLAPKMALLFNIPLVFYGENEVEYGNPIADASTAERDQSYFSSKNLNDISLGGVKIETLIDQFGLEHVDLQPYLPANVEDLFDKKISVRYLGYYLKWHPQECYYYAAENGGFEASPERTPGTYSKYNSIDDRIDDLHYYTTGVKFGLGRASYDAAQEIRSGDIDRNEGVALVKKFDHEFPNRFIDELLRYLSITPNEFPVASQMFESPEMDREYFDRLVDSFRSPHLWVRNDEEWTLREAVWH